MTHDELKSVAKRLVPLMKKARSKNESNLDVARTDHYKPIYGALAVLIAPLYRDLMGLPDHVETDPSTCLSIKDCETIMCEAHPYFIKAITEDRGSFESSYEFIRGAYYQDVSS